MRSAISLVSVVFTLELNGSAGWPCPPQRPGIAGIDTGGPQGPAVAHFEIERARIVRIIGERPLIAMPIGGQLRQDLRVCPERSCGIA